MSVNLPLLSEKLSLLIDQHILQESYRSNPTRVTYPICYSPNCLCGDYIDTPCLGRITLDSKFMNTYPIAHYIYEHPDKGGCLVVLMKDESCVLCSLGDMKSITWEWNPSEGHSYRRVSDPLPLTVNESNPNCVKFGRC